MATQRGGEPGDERRRPRPTLAFRWRFRPQLIAFLFGLFCAWFAVAGLVESGIHVLWGPTFRQVDYTMSEARYNDGYPYITGTLQTTGEEFRVAARRSGDTYLVGREGSDVFAAGKVVKLWWSPSAPDLAIEGRRTNGIPVSAMPERPGVLRLVGYTVLLLVVVALTARLVRWAAGKARNQQVRMRL